MNIKYFQKSVKCEYHLAQLRTFRQNICVLLMITIIATAVDDTRYGPPLLIFMMQCSPKHSVQ